MENGICKCYGICSMQEQFLKILDMHWSMRDSPDDQLLWIPNRSGEFTVKSAYSLLFRDVSILHGLAHWQKLWK